MAFEASIQFMQGYVKCSVKYVYFKRMGVVFKSCIVLICIFDDELNALRILSHKSINTTNSNKSKSFLNVEAVFHSDVLSEVKDVLVNTFNICV